MKSRFFVLWLLLTAMVVPPTTLVSCAKSAEHATRYHCPMHPTYVADRPGDCPICGMRLVPIEEKSATTSAAASVIAPSEHHHPAAGASAAPGSVIWTCPMDPEVVSDHPDRCPKCGMKLEPKPASPPAPGVSNASPLVPGLAPIDISARGLELAGVRTEAAVLGKISRSIRAVGIVRADETRVRHVHTKTSGWVEKLYVNSTGESVARGRPILSIYSQELLAAQHEYLQAKNGIGAFAKSTDPTIRDSADTMMAAARRRLELLDVPVKQINELERTGVAVRTIVLSAPVSGVVMSKSIFEGQQVDPGMDLFTVTDLSQVWIEGDIYENESASVRVGQEGQISFVSDPLTIVKSKIKYIYPYLNAETRTLRVRFVLPNPGFKLKLDSYANVEIPVETDEGAIIADSAILDTGLRQVVFVNTVGGHFEPRLVKVGIRAEGRAQILNGVSPGEQVAVKANFLLDSESRLRAALLPPTAQPTATVPAAPPKEHTGSHP